MGLGPKDEKNAGCPIQAFCWLEWDKARSGYMLFVGAGAEACNSFSH
jgi:hypothetical protein